MPSQATGSAEALSRPLSATGAWQTLGRHQIGAAIASCVDFGTMILCVEKLSVSPVAATAVGATLGAITNFCLGRMWIFRRKSGHPAGQAARYALASAAGAGWNALGEHLAHDLAHMQYVLARILVAIVVSVFWNFPVQRRFVFREGRTG